MLYDCFRARPVVGMQFIVGFIFREPYHRTCFKWPVTDILFQIEAKLRIGYIMTNIDEAINLTYGYKQTVFKKRDYL
jgi:hypothetical protein